MEKRMDYVWHERARMVGMCWYGNVRMPAITACKLRVKRVNGFNHTANVRNVVCMGVCVCVSCYANLSLSAQPQRHTPH